MSCTELGKHCPLPPPGAPHHTLQGNQNMQHPAACGEAQTSAFSGRVCVQRQVQRRERKNISQFNQKATGSSTCPGLSLFFFSCLFALVFNEKCRGHVSRAWTAPQPKQWHLEGISPGQSSNLVGKSPSPAPALSDPFPQLASGSLAPHTPQRTQGFWQAGGEGDPPLYPLEILLMLTSPQPTAYAPNAGSPQAALIPPQPKLPKVPNSHYGGVSTSTPAAGSAATSPPPRSPPW